MVSNDFELHFFALKGLNRLEAACLRTASRPKRKLLIVEVGDLRRLGSFFLFLVWLSAAFMEGAEASESMKLDEYLSRVLQGNRSLKADMKSVEAQYYAVLSGVAVQRPQMGVSASGSWLSGQTMMGAKDSDITAGGVNLGVTHRIDISGSYSLDERQRILGYEARRAQFDATLNALIATAEETWWSAVLARENVALQKDILRQRSENHRVTTEKFRQQLVPKLDVVRSEAQVVEAESLVKESETLYLNLLANLSYLAGGADVVPFEEPLYVPVFDISLSYEKALEARPDVRAARLAVDRARTVKKLTGKGLAPTLDFGMQWTAWADPELSAAPQEGEAAASLKLNIPIVDGNRTRYGVLNADRLLESAEQGLASLEDQARRDLSIAMNDWKKASVAEQDKKRQVERAEEELHITELMYSEGMGAQIDLINAQTAYQGVRTQYLNAVKEMYVALVRLRRAVGDYAPDESGDWREAVVRYGKGRPVADEVAAKSLRDQRNKGIKSSNEGGKPKAKGAPKGKKTKK